MTTMQEPITVVTPPRYTDHQVTQMPGLTIRILPSDGYSSPSGRLAEAEIIFDGPLSGLRLIGFGVWERRSPKGRRNVTFPARTYAVNGERRSFALLRPVTDINATDALRDAIIAAYIDHAGQPQTCQESTPCPDTQ